MQFSADMADQLFQNRAVMFDPEKGWRLNTHNRYPDDTAIPRSPFYIDLRAPLRSAPLFRKRMTWYMETLLRKSDISFDCISDAPQAVTPLVVALSNMICIPMISPRLNAKSYGLENEIDGFWRAGQSVAIIDDLRTSGRTLKDIIALYRRNGLTVSACFTAIDRSAEEGSFIGDVPYFAGFEWSELLGFYRDRRVITPELYDRCIRYPAELKQYMDMHHPSAV